MKYIIAVVLAYIVFLLIISQPWKRDTRLSNCIDSIDQQYALNSPEYISAREKCWMEFSI